MAWTLFKREKMLLKGEKVHELNTKRLRNLKNMKEKYENDRITVGKMIDSETKKLVLSSEETELDLDIPFTLSKEVLAIVSGRISLIQKKIEEDIKALETMIAVTRDDFSKPEIKVVNEETFEGFFLKPRVEQMYVIIREESLFCPRIYAFAHKDGEERHDMFWNMEAAVQWLNAQCFEMNTNALFHAFGDYKFFKEANGKFLFHFNGVHYAFILNNPKSVRFGVREVVGFCSPEEAKKWLESNS